MAELKIGTKIKDRYTLIEFKGRGSFGEVWLAHDDERDEDIAVKIYISLDERGIEEFESEYTTTLGLVHPNLLTATCFDVYEQHPFLVMKFCSKGSTSKLSGNVDESTLWKFIRDVSSGLNYLHSLPEPIIHQDIKPDNILVDNTDCFLISDFGISKKLRSTMRKQSTRAVGAGAVPYMGPEKFESNPVTIKASDIWALGVSIYELATGELPFSGMGGGMLRNGAELPSLDNRWSAELNMVMRSCLAKDTWDRPTAHQLEEYAASIIKGEHAEVTWNGESTTNVPVVASYTSDNKSPSNSPEKFGEDKSHSNKKRIWLAIGGIITAIVLLILIWPSNKVEEPIVIPEDTIEADTTVVEVFEGKVSDIPEVEPTQKQKEQTAVPANNTTKEQTKATPKNEEPKTDNNAAILKNALANGDYEQVQKLANQGYAAAYGPLAKYYLIHHDYKTAESYAKKAKAAGFSDGSSVLKTLENLGYND